MAANCNVYEESLSLEDQYENDYATTDNNFSVQINTLSTQTIRKPKTRRWFLIIVVALALVSGIVGITTSFFVSKGIAARNMDSKNNTEPKPEQTTLENLPNIDIMKQELDSDQTRCGRGWISLKDHCYYFGEKNLTWEESESECLGMNSNLVKIESQTENDVIVAKVKMSGDSMSYWIGLNDKQNETDFTWISDNSRTTFRDWAPDEPMGNGRHCVQLWWKAAFYWDDEYCSVEQFYICERPELSQVTQDRLDSLEKKLKDIETVLCGKNWRLLLGNCYFLGGTKQNWTESERKCKDMNASLVKINSKEENNILVETIKKSGLKNTEVYIGLRRYGWYQKRFVWTDGSHVSFADWSEGQPTFTHKGKQEECVEITHRYQWNDIACSTYKTFICEKTPRYF